MKFGQTLLENMLSEWSQFYINYKKLKKILKILKKNFLYFTHKTIKENKLTDKSFKYSDNNILNPLKIQESMFIPGDPKFQLSLLKKRIKFYRQLCVELHKVNFFPLLRILNNY